MSASKIIRTSLFVFVAVTVSYYVAHAQTGNTGGSSGGTGGGQHGEGSGPGINVPGTGGVNFSGDPDANPYATTPTPPAHFLTEEPSATPKHGRSKSRHDKAANVSPSPSR